MKPSSWSTSRTRTRRVDAGHSTEERPRICALRMRVSISPNGSVIIMAASSLPARLHEAGDLALATQFAERDATHLELAVKGARPTRHFTTVAHAAWRRVSRQLGQPHTR